MSHSRFRSALFDPEMPVPNGLIDMAGSLASHGFSVHRNNVIVSLCEAMDAAFPLVRKLLGHANFRNLAAAYVRTAPPTSPLMMHYGQKFPEFIQQSEQLRSIGYLSDCARLDLVMRTSYHAADATPLDPSDLQIPPAALSELRVQPAPATIILRSAWPLFDLWRYNTGQDAPEPMPVPQDVMVSRSQFDPLPFLLPRGAADWYNALAKGATLALAQEQAQAAFPDFDLSETISQALSTGALTLVQSRRATQ